MTGLRGVTALWVLLFHLESFSLETGRWPAIFLLQNGWAGVDLFFILSGFVVAEAYGASLARPSFAKLIAYARARCLRIYPVSSVALAGTALLYLIDPPFARWYASLDVGNLTAGSFVATLMLATRWLPISGDWNQPVWSLSVEMIGYASFPFIALILRHARSAAAMIAAAFILLLVTAAALVKIGMFGVCALDSDSSLLRMIGGFGAGALLHRAAVLAPVDWRHGAPMVGVASVGMIALLGSLPLGGGLLPFAFAPLILSLAWDEGLVSRLLCKNWVQALGRISFPLYLIHVTPMLMVRFHLGADRAVSNAMWAGAQAGVVICSLCVAALLHRLVESPAHRLSRTPAGVRFLPGGLRRASVLSMCRKSQDEPGCGRLQVGG